MSIYPKVLTRGEESGGRVAVIESVMPAGTAGPPLHKHDFDEAFYVLEGELDLPARLRPGHGRRRRVGLCRRRETSHPHQPQRRTGSLPDRLHAGRLRARVCPPCRPQGGRAAAGVGTWGDPARHPARASDRRAGLSGGELVEIRPMQHADLVGAERASDATFIDADRRNRKVGEPEIEPRSASASQAWCRRMRFYLETDPGGCWIAASRGEVIGFAISQNRGRVWYLATYGVVPERQGRGIGRQLLDVALEHAADRPGLFSSTVHPGATRRYRLAGFSLHPQMRMVGTVDRSALPAVRGQREGREDDIEWMDSLDRDLRGAGHGPDHRFMMSTLRLIVSDDEADPGYVYLNDEGPAAARRAASRHRAQPAVASAGIGGRRHPHQLHHDGERVGRRRRPRGSPRDRTGGLPGGARHAAAGAVPGQRTFPVNAERGSADAGSVTKHAHRCHR